MLTAHLGLAILMALIAVISGVLKLKREPQIIHVIHNVVKVPLKWISWLAVCEFVGALGSLIGLVWPLMGVAAAGGVVLYSAGAVVPHLRVGDVKGTGSPAFPLVFAMAYLVTRILSV